jgi:hypothetical protein
MYYVQSDLNRLMRQSRLRKAPPAPVHRATWKRIAPVVSRLLTDGVRILRRETYVPKSITSFGAHPLGMTMGGWP